MPPLDPTTATTPDTAAALVALRKRALGVLAGLSGDAIELGELFRAAGHELALVGGPVRDAFLGRLSADLDFTTSATPDETEAILARWGDAHWDIGKEFGTIGARRMPGGRRGAERDVVVEVTTYRTDAYDPSSRKPEVVFGDTLEGDLSRRDFTVNAMAVRLPELTFVDPFDGLADLARGVLRTPVDPRQSFDDDPLRMMRAARFAAQLGFTVEPAARAAIEDMAERIGIVSAERVRDELSKLLVAAQPRAGLEVLVDTGLADHVLPELPALRLEIDEHHRHKDVYEHSLTVLDKAIALETGPDGPVPGPDLVLRLAALLHDIGKPRTRRFEPGGGVSFHHHEVVGAKLAAKRLKELRFDKATVQAVSRLTELHLRFHGYGEGGWTDSAVRRYVTDAGPLLERLHRLTRSDCTTRNLRKAARLSAAYDDLETRIARLQEQEELAAIRPDLDGTQIMEILGIGPGREVGAAYKHLLELRMDRGPLGPDEARAELLQWWDEFLNA
ncbi:CCA tRNA nucleotidyltransferase [Cellulomonas fimi]|uniref:Polynucleotide adenylyltransferase/metal dependent phosphohydrolase n=1 Tax=Cellulomonas fimi (strain ATCC 484 / DSM 20113 / JCM 1341 / CCUG 24087 / LMG 16345 / NBRC 15513 / NCIMB 8980 / NCTC 7547 / NRS-133) TaxID=590998 RepID=F4H5H5_CELFA|nr:polynucleotide adenylyltransferase/metal dependent phosphohydrolase [Cellulomonas fimi ATCC 484]NNH09050.1 CCA tRNA nucleotidyltransferase [Cellulomonas fimi]VEH37098.1 CCA-adding enzyme [Cellulomonas fimi]